MRKPLSLAAACVAAALLSGCSGTAAPSQPPASNAPASQASKAPASSGASAQSTSASTAGPAAFGFDPANPPPAMATVTVTGGKSERTENIKIELIELRRREKLLYGLFRVTPKGSYTESMSLYDLFHDWAPTLVNYDKMQESLRISELSSDVVYTETRSEEPMYAKVAWGYPEGAKTVDIKLGGDIPAVFEQVSLP